MIRTLQGLKKKKLNKFKKKSDKDKELLFFVFVVVAVIVVNLQNALIKKKKLCPCVYLDKK